jgi:hypothetical protein
VAKNVAYFCNFHATAKSKKSPILVTLPVTGFRFLRQCAFVMVFNKASKKMKNASNAVITFISGNKSLASELIS